VKSLFIVDSGYVRDVLSFPDDSFHFTLVPFFSLSQAAQRPNIVVIFCDDMGYGELGCFGTKGWNHPQL